MSITCKERFDKFVFHFIPGEVVVWDTSQTEETLVASSGIGDDSHRDPVSKLSWIPDPDSKGKKFHVMKAHIAHFFLC
jgi:hypothetical protein